MRICAPVGKTLPLRHRQLSPTNDKAATHEPSVPHVYSVLKTRSYHPTANRASVRTGAHTAQRRSYTAVTPRAAHSTPVRSLSAPSTSVRFQHRSQRGGQRPRSLSSTTGVLGRHPRDDTIADPRRTYVNIVNTFCLWRRPGHPLSPSPTMRIVAL